jgi:hypothetical protein
VRTFIRCHAAKSVQTFSGTHPARANAWNIDAYNYTISKAVVTSIIPILSRDGSFTDRNFDANFFSVF